MACDRFVYFQTVPSREDVRKALEDYLGEVAVSIDDHPDRLIATIRGEGSNPFRRLGNTLSMEEEGRWVEVVFGDDSIDVLTRRQDELTNNIAAGFAKLVARFWQGTLEEE